MSKAITVLVTTGSVNEAREIAKTLVGENLAACCNIIQSVESVFNWQGKVNIENEALMICKTKEEVFEKVRERVQQLHSYDVPEIIALPITQGSKDYLDWVVQETS